MDINDIEIKIKKHDQEKNIAIINVTFFGQLEIRGYRAMLLETKTLPIRTFWKILPPCVKKTKKEYFWIARFLDKDLWLKLQEKIIEKVNDYPEDV